MRGVHPSEIQFDNVVRIFRQNFLLLLFFPALSFLLAALYLHFATYTYTSTLIVTPIEKRQSSLPNNLRGIAGLAGISLPASSDELQFELYIAGVHSRFAADKLAARPDLMKQIFAQEWSEKDQEWREPSGFVHGLKKLIKVIIGIPTTKWHAPDGSRAQQYLTTHVAVSQDRNSPIVTLTLDTKDPGLGVNILAFLHQVVDTQLRTKALNRADSYIDYLTKKLQTVTVADYREALTAVLSDQEKTRMMASSDLPFAAEPYESPTSSTWPTSPQPLFVLAGFVGLGVLVSALILLWLIPRETR